MPETNFFDPDVFSATLYEKMARLNPGIAGMEPYEFRYGLNNLIPAAGWNAVTLEAAESIEQRVNRRSFYDGIQIKPRQGEHIILDENILQLARMLLVGLASGAYAEEWIRAHFYFDIRGFYFLHRTTYFTPGVRAHLARQPFRQFEPRQTRFETMHEIGYRDFKEANAEVDALFIESVQQLLALRGTPTILAIAGPTAAGKTEIVERLREAFQRNGQKTTPIELDNFLTDRDYREAQGIFTQGKEALHFELFRQSLADICQGKKISIPRYDFVYATSSHDLEGRLKPGCSPIEIEPADVIFIEGNFPFLIPETAALIGIKVVYLTDDAVRLKRKWRRDIDYRKKYEPNYFRNRFFKDQFIMAEIAYRPQMELCDLVVDTTGAALWATPQIIQSLVKDSPLFPEASNGQSPSFAH